MPSRPKIVIVGAGFGGLYAARALGKAPADVVVVDRHNYHLFQPLLYQVATAGLSPGDIAYPIRSVLRSQTNTRVLLDSVVAIEPEQRRVRLAGGSLTYDYLILAAGAADSYFQHPEWRQFAPGLKSLNEALEIRRRILLAFEHAEQTVIAAGDGAAKRRLLTFVLVGAGPTGVEMAGAIAEIATHVMVQDFRAIDPRAARVVLIEAGDRILPAMPADLSQKATRALRARGIEIRLHTRVVGVDPAGVSLELGDGQIERLEAANVLWSAGVTGSPLAATLGVPLERGGRIRVTPELRVAAYPEIFVIGDLAWFPDGQGNPLPGLAPVAIQQGTHAARNIIRELSGRPARPFHYVDKGTLATIGRASAVADIHGLHLSGPLAWLVWIFVHILYLIGFRNRFIVAFEWAWSYLTYQKAARLIT
jgi:NADH dehydrogenase